MWKYGPGYGKWGLMVGSVFVKIMEDVESEGWKEVRLQWQEGKCGEVWGKKHWCFTVLGAPTKHSKKPLELHDACDCLYGMACWALFWMFGGHELQECFVLAMPIHRDILCQWTDPQK